MNRTIATLTALFAAASITACSPTTENAPPAPTPSTATASTPATPATPAAPTTPSAPATPLPSDTPAEEAEPVEAASLDDLNDYTFGLFTNCMSDLSVETTADECEVFAREAQKNGVHDRASHNRWIAEVAGKVDAEMEAEAYATEGDAALDAEETDLVMNCPGDEVTETSSDCDGADLPSDGE